MMKTILCGIVLWMGGITAFAQTASQTQSAYFDMKVVTPNCLPKMYQLIGPYPLYGCSKLTDDGAHLLYNGSVIGGGTTFAPPAVTVQTAATYTLSPSACTTGGATISFTYAAGNVAVTLPQPGANFPAGCVVRLRNSTTTDNGPTTQPTHYLLTLTPTGSIIGGGSSFVIQPLTDCWIQSDGTNWRPLECRFLSMPAGS